MSTASIKTTDELAKESETRTNEPSTAIAVTPPAESTAVESSEAMQVETSGADENGQNMGATGNVVEQSDAAQSTKNKKSKPADSVDSTSSKAKPAPRPVSEKEIGEFSASLEKLSFKNTTKLVAGKTMLNKLKKRMQADDEKLAELLSAIEVRLGDLLEKNKSHQEKLQSATVELLAGLKMSLADGKSADALIAWDKIQGNISNTLGKARAELQNLANEHRDAINELREWKIFASTEKKKQLIEQMKHLSESKMHASDRSKHIATMHKEWKLLGRSNQNEELWTEFKTLSDTAYEPCKEYFKQRKLQMAENLKKRREICDQLEKDVAQLDDTDLNISQVNKLLSGAESQWKKYAPVEQSKVNKLQKRFYGLINQLRKLRRNSVKGNAKAKQECIDAAIALAALEDNNKAMSEAKSLQQQWKKIGPTSFKEDKKYWEDFRSACDKIFEQKNSETELLKEELVKAETNLNETLKQLEGFLAFEDEEFRDCRGQYQELMQKFSSELDPRLKAQRKKLVDQFNGIKRKIDMRFKSLPDKKLLQLIEKITAKTSFLQAIESDLSGTTTDDAVNQQISETQKAEWQSLSATGQEELDNLLNQRWLALNKLKTKAELNKLVTQASNTMRDICIDLEIRANIESPATDQASRMTIQLAQLKSGFGKAKPDREDNAKFAKAMELRLTCIGPIDSDSRADYLTRAAAAIQRLK